MISQKTIFSFLLALLLAICIRAWTLRQVGPCDAYKAGQLDAPSSVVINPQGHAMIIPCNQWLLRQPRSVQVSCLVDAGLFVIFLIGASADWTRRRRARTY